MAYDPTLIKICPSILRMDKRVCRIEVQCCWYDPEHDGEPCTESIDQCDYVQSLIEKAITSLESDHDAQVEDLQEQIESREDQLREANAEIETQQKIIQIAEELQGHLERVLEKLENLKK